jgi:hypothetical protein
VCAKPPANTPPVATSPTALRLTTDAKTYAPNAPIRFVFTVTNKTNRPLRFSFMTAQETDFVVVQEASKSAIWTWSEGRFFAEMLNTKTLAPGKSLVYKETFTPKKPLAVGTYRATASLKAKSDRDAPILAKTVFKVVPVLPNPKTGKASPRSDERSWR